MKKILTLTIVALLALFAIPTMVNAVETSTELKNVLENDEATITLEGDITLAENITISDGKTKILDLNGKTLTQGSNFIIVEEGTLTVKNGKIVSDGDAFEVLSKGSAILNIEEDVDVTAGECAVYIKYPGSVLNTAGNLKSTGTEYAAIQGNGSTGSGGIVVNITGGSITSKIEAIYFPNTTELNISGGTITGTTAVYHKSGKLNITGGELNAIGDKADYVYNANGCNGTGDALVIEASDYPGGVPVVSISGGIFTSKNNKAVGYYKQTENYKLANEKFITGGDFNQDVSKYVPAGYVTIETAADLGLYRVKLNTPYVTGERVTVDDSLTGKIEIGIIEEAQGELNEIFEQEMEKNSKLKEALLDGKEVNVHVQMDKIEEKDINEKELKAMKKAVKEGKFVKFYDITLVMTADKTEKLGTITEISNKLTFKVLVPEELVKEGRTFFMYRYHDEKIEKLTGELDENNYFTFQSDRFSTYALAFEDKVDEPTEGGQGTAVKQPEKDETPKTGSIDVVLYASAIIATISLAGLVLVKKYTK